MHSAGYHEKMIGRTYFGGDQVTQLHLVLYNTIKWPYQPKHSPSSGSILLHIFTSDESLRPLIISAGSLVAKEGFEYCIWFSII